MVQLPRLLLLVCGAFAVAYATTPDSGAIDEVVIEQWKLDYQNWRNQVCPDCIELCLNPKLRWHDHHGWVDSLLLSIVRSS